MFRARGKFSKFRGVISLVRSLPSEVDRSNAYFAHQKFITALDDPQTGFNKRRSMINWYSGMSPQYSHSINVTSARPAEMHGGYKRSVTTISHVFAKAHTSVYRRGTSGRCGLHSHTIYVDRGDRYWR